MTAEDVLNKTMEILTTDQFRWQGDNRTFVAEASELEHFNGHIAQTIMLKNLKTGMMKVFNKCGVDIDGEDVFGWRYRNVTDGDLKILIIND